MRVESVTIDAYNFFDELFHTGVAMPCYEFYCEDCKKPFEIILTLAEYEKDKFGCLRNAAVNTCTRRPPRSSL